MLWPDSGVGRNAARVSARAVSVLGMGRPVEERDRDIVSTPEVGSLSLRTAGREGHRLNSWRRYLDYDTSWDAEATKLVQGDYAFGLQNGWYEDPSNWKTFNQVLARYLSSPDARPIASPNDDAVVVSYADAVPMGTWAIDSASDFVDPDGVAIKSMTIRNVERLIGDDSPYKDAFANGTLTHSFLFGGSDFVMLFQDKVDFTIDAPTT